MFIYILIVVRKPQNILWRFSLCFGSDCLAKMKWHNFSFLHLFWLRSLMLAFPILIPLHPLPIKLLRIWLMCDDILYFIIFTHWKFCNLQSPLFHCIFILFFLMLYKKKKKMSTLKNQMFCLVSVFGFLIWAGFIYFLIAKISIQYFKDYFMRF